MSRRGTGHQRRKFRPKNKEKYVGNSLNITSRSSWEYLMMNWLDKHPSVIKWNSEEVVIEYVSPVDSSTHRYFVDFWVKYRAIDGSIKEKIVEIKPFAQTVKPSNRHAKSYEDQVKTFVVNEAKWEAAKKYAERTNMEFQVLTEYDLGLARR